ncbi:MAG: hypothetical protein ACK4WK_11410, partial [Anaerolineae bacterium]
MLIGLAGALWALAIATYFWSRDLFGERAGIIAALAAVYGPYILYDVYRRGSPASIWALVWLTLTAWAARRMMVRNGAGPLACTALGSAALILTHNVTALIGIPLLVGYILFLARLYGLRASLRPLLALILGMGLSTFFWMPALLEQDFVQIYQLYLPLGFDYHYNFISLGQLLTPPRPVDPALINQIVPISLGWVPLALALIGWGPLGTLLPREVRAHRWAFSLALLGLALMTLPVSLPVWEHIPLLRFVQFPWRFLAPATIVLALLAGIGAETLTKRAPWGLPVILIGLIAFAQTWLFPAYHSPKEDQTPPDQIRYEMQSGCLGATAAGDYLPVWVQERPAPDSLLSLYEAAA